MKKKLALLLLICAGVAVGVIIFQRRNAADVPKGVADSGRVAVAMKSIKSTVRSVGRINPASVRPVRAAVEGRVETVEVKRGQRVAKGAVICRLSTSAAKREILRAERALEIARIKVAAAKEGVAVGQEAGDGPKGSFRVRILELEEKNAVDDVEEARAALANSVITAPVDGVVTAVTIQPEQLVFGEKSAGGSVVAEISDTSTYVLICDVNEVEVERLSRGQEATVTFDAIPGLQQSGTVASIGEAANQGFGVKVTQFPVEISFKSPASIKLGMTANVSVKLREESAVPAIPLTSVFFEEGVSYVIAMGPNGFARREVVLGVNDLSFVEVKDGLVVGEFVAKDYLPYIKHD